MYWPLPVSKGVCSVCIDLGPFQKESVQFVLAFDSFKKSLHCLDWPSSVSKVYASPVTMFAAIHSKFRNVMKNNCLCYNFNPLKLLHENAF